MKIQQISYFVTLARTLSFTKTAEVHFISQTAVSQQIRLLEEDLGAQLFARSNRRVALTPAGRRFYEQAVKILDLIEIARQQVREAPQHQKELVIGLAGVDNSYVVQLMKGMTDRYSDVGLAFQKCTYDQILQGVLNRQMDLGITLEMYPSDVPEIEKRTVAHLPQYAVVSNKSRFAQHNSLTRKQMDGEDYYMPKTSRHTAGRMQDVFREAGCSHIRVIQEDSMDSVLLKISFGQGFTIMAESALHWISPELNLAVIPLENETVPLCFMRNRENEHPALDFVFNSSR
jgi:DNA-binding transcriptional LysR family regulator